MRLEVDMKRNERKDLDLFRVADQRKRKIKQKQLLTFAACERKRKMQSWGADRKKKKKLLQLVD